MKKFFFALDTVLSYKEQVLDGLKAEHARILAKIRDCERAIQELEQEYARCTALFRENQVKGMKINEIQTYENYLESLRLKIRRKLEQLAQLQKQEEEKRAEVVRAKQETSSIDKLKEKKKWEYDKMVQKEDEQFIEEYVTTQKAMTRLKG
ncbi:MAG: flagellar export protein FliJ [Hespellia sp.]|nr:flagellar export protein FliJ [Hespellia sp.]